MCFSGKLHHRPVALNLRSLLLHSIRRFCCSVAFGLVASLSSWDLVFASKEWPMAVFVQGVHGAPGTWQDSNPQLFLSRSWKQLKSLLSRPAVADLVASPVECGVGTAASLRGARVWTCRSLLCLHFWGGSSLPSHTSSPEPCPSALLLPSTCS